MAYTVADLKDLTSVPAVTAFSDAKILQYQTAAEAILGSLNLDTTVDGYLNAYNSALLILFDMIAKNPTGVSSVSEGKFSESYPVDSLPLIVRQILAKAMGGNKAIFGTNFVRKDIGLR